MSLFTTDRSGVFDLHDRIPGGIVFELGDEIGIVCVLGGFRNADLLVVCRGFVEDVVKSIGLFDLVKYLLNLRGESCKSFCHDEVMESESREKRVDFKGLQVELTPTFAGKAPHDRQHMT